MTLSEHRNDFIRQNSPDGGFLQSEEWRRFQESVGRRTFHLESDGFWANVIEHKLPIVGRYGYVPRGPIFKIQNSKFKIQTDDQEKNCKIQEKISELFDLAKAREWGWVRFDANDDAMPESIRKNTDVEIAKAPHDMQPKELFIVDITKSEEQLLKEMKPKTRYNIRLAEKKGVTVLAISNQSSDGPDIYVEEFLRLNRVMAKRNGIATHDDGYYRKMFETIPSDMLQLYVAEFEGQMIAASFVSFFGDTATYLHGASDDRYRNVMAPHLVQWRAIGDAKGEGCSKYDFGGIHTHQKSGKWSGITAFKLGFSPETAPVRFSGSFDIVMNPWRYRAYKALQKAKSLLR